MADELQLYADPATDSGKTVIARVYDDSGTQVGGDVSMAEVGTLAIYQGDMPAAAAGVYSARFFEGTDLLGNGPIYWDGSAEVDLIALNTAVGAIWSGTLEGALTRDQAMRLILSAVAGKVSVSGSTVTMRDTADTTDRIVSVTTTDGERTSVTLDGA